MIGASSRSSALWLVRRSGLVQPVKVLSGVLRNRHEERRERAIAKGRMRNELRQLAIIEACEQRQRRLAGLAQSGKERLGGFSAIFVGGLLIRPIDQVAPRLRFVAPGLCIEA